MRGAASRARAGLTPAAGSGTGPARPGAPAGSGPGRRPAAPWLTEGADGGLTLALHVQPGAKRTEVAGTHGDALKVRLAAPPVEGRANAALLRFLADAFGVPLRAVEIVRGEAARDKLVRIAAPARRPDRGW